MSKHRSTIYAVVRNVASPRDNTPVLCSAHLTIEAAEEAAGRCEQVIKEIGYDHKFYFEVQAVTYYDE